MTVLIAAMAEAAQEVAIKPLYKAPKCKLEKQFYAPLTGNEETR